MPLGWIGLGVAGLGGIFSGISGADTKRQLGNAANLAPINPNSSLNNAITANQNNLGGIETLTGNTNQFNIGQQQQALESQIPGFAAAQQQRVGNASSLLRGEIPQDVSDAVLRSDAAKAVSGGYAGSGVQRNLTARDLGRTSLDLQNLGNQQIGSIVASTPMASLVGAQNYQLNPSSVYASDVQQNLAKQRALQTSAQSGGLFGALGSIL